MFGAVGEADWARLEHYKAMLEVLPDGDRAVEISRIASEEMDSPALVNLLLMTYPPEERPAVLFEEGDVIAERYRVVREIGYGGMGVVYEAVQAHTNRRVALKVIHPYLFTSHEAEGHLSERFAREITILGELNHPGIVTIYEADALVLPGASNPSLFFAMELIEGVSLRQYAERNPLSEREAANLLAHVSDAVGYAHENGIVHRDLKPANVLVREDGMPVVLDFGLANATLDLAERDASAILSGTPEYMSPELLLPFDSEAPPDGQTGDVYALGVIAFEVITGTRLHSMGREKTLREVREAILSAPEPNVKASVKSPRLTRVLTQALMRDPRDRYVSASEFAAGLRAAVRPLVTLRTSIALAVLGILLVCGTFLVKRYEREAQVARELAELERALVAGDRDLGMDLLAKASPAVSPVDFRSKAVALFALPSGLELERVPVATEVSEYVLSPDGEYRAVPGEASRVLVENAKTGVLVADLHTTLQHEPYRPGSCVAGAMCFSPDGKQLAVASSSSFHVLLWSLKTAELDGVLYHSSPVTAIDWNKNALVTGLTNGGVCEWSELPRDGAFADEPKRIHEGVGMPVLALDQDRSGDRLAILTAEKVILVDPASGEVVVEESLPGHAYQEVKLAPEALGVVLGGKDSARLSWRQEPPVFHVDFAKPPVDAVWAPGERSVMVLVDHEIVTIDAVEGQEVSRVAAALGAGLAVSQSSGTLYTSDRFGVHPWNVVRERFRKRDSLSSTKAPARLALSRSPQKLAMINSETLRVYDLENKVFGDTIAWKGGKVLQMALAPNASSFAVHAQGDALSILDQKGVVQRSLAGVTSFAYVDEGLLVSDVSGDAICLDTLSWEPTSWKVSGLGKHLAVSEDGRYLLSGSDTSDVTLRSYPQAELITRLPYSELGSIRRLSLSSDGGLAMILTERGLLIWKLDELNQALSQYGRHWQEVDQFRDPAASPLITF